MNLLVILAVSGIVFGGACAILASNKNRDAFGWFVLGFLFNLIALIVIAGISRLDPKEANAEKKGPETAGELNQEDLRKKAAELSAALQQSKARLNR